VPNLSPADRKAIAKLIAEDLRAPVTKAVTEQAVQRVLEEVTPAKPLHEMTTEEFAEYGSVVWPLAVKFGGRR